MVEMPPDGLDLAAEAEGEEGLLVLFCSLSLSLFNLLMFLSVSGAEGGMTTFPPKRLALVGVFDLGEGAGT